MELPDPEAMEELDSELDVILDMLEDRTGLAELRGDELWYRTSRHGAWLMAISVPTDLVEHHRNDVIELLEAFNVSVADGRARHDLPELAPLPKGRLPANAFEVDHAELVADVVRAAIQATSPVDRWEADRSGKTREEALSAAVKALVKVEAAQRESPAALLADFDLGPPK